MTIPHQQSDWPIRIASLPVGHELKWESFTDLDRGRYFYKKEDYKAAFFYFENAAIGGHPTGYLCIGLCYWFGRGRTASRNLAFLHIKQAAELGHPEAMFYLAQFYETGLPSMNLAPSPAKAHRWYSGAGEKHPEARERHARLLKHAPHLANQQVQAFTFTGTGPHRLKTH